MTTTLVNNAQLDKLKIQETWTDVWLHHA
jgi:hypothetical protein